MPQISHKGKILPASAIRKLVPFADAAKERGIKRSCQDRIQQVKGRTCKMVEKILGKGFTENQR